MAIDDVSDVSDPAVQRHLSRIGDEMAEFRAEMRELRRYVREGFEALAAMMVDMRTELRAELRIEIRNEIAELRVDVGRMIAANTESLRADWRVMLEQSDARFAAQQARLDAHIADPNAHTRG